MAGRPAWLTTDLDHYLSAMRESIPAITRKEELAAAENWLAWIGQYRIAIDPLRHSLRMPPDRKPSKGTYVLRPEDRAR